MVAMTDSGPGAPGSTTIAGRPSRTQVFAPLFLTARKYASVTEFTPSVPVYRRSWHGRAPAGAGGTDEAVDGLALAIRS
jgi:hypothetical protein